MKIVFFTIALFCSFATINAQASLDMDTSKDSTIETSKVGFFKALVEKNDFDITIEEAHTTVANLTKEDFYTLLIEKNNLNINIANDTLLTHTPTHNTAKTAKTSEIAGLVP